jgi:hypothetical protein
VEFTKSTEIMLFSLILGAISIVCGIACIWRSFLLDQYRDLLEYYTTNYRITRHLQEIYLPHHGIDVKIFNAPLGFQAYLVRDPKTNELQGVWVPGVGHVTSIWNWKKTYPILAPWPGEIVPDGTPTKIITIDKDNFGSMTIIEIGKRCGDKPEIVLCFSSMNIEDYIKKRWPARWWVPLILLAGQCTTLAIPFAVAFVRMATRGGMYR